MIAQLRILALGLLLASSQAAALPNPAPDASNAAPVAEVEQRDASSTGELAARDSHGCYGSNSKSRFLTWDALGLAQTACRNMNLGTIPNGETRGYWVYSGSKNVFVSFTAKQSGGWYVDTNFCNNVVRDIINSCQRGPAPGEWDDGSRWTNGGSWTYSGQGVGNVDTGPD